MAATRPSTVPTYMQNLLNQSNQPNSAGLNGALGGIGSGLFDLFGTKNPADPAMNYLSQINQSVAPYLNPYIQAGQGAMGQLQGQYGNLINDPNSVLKRIGSGYQQSPGYQWQLGQALQAGNQSAAAGGMVGSPAAQQWSQQTASGLANQDYYNYLKQALGLYGTGLEGLGGINKMGFDASTGMANNLANMLANQAGLSYAGQINQNQQGSGGFGSLLGGIGSLAGLGPISGLFGNLFS